MPPERGRGGPASTSQRGKSGEASSSDPHRRRARSGADDGDANAARRPDLTIGTRAREQLETLLSQRRDRSSRARPDGRVVVGARAASAPEGERDTDEARAATAKALATAHNNEVLRLAALRKGIVPLGGDTGLDDDGACGVRASTTREDLERNDRRGVRADDLGVPDELLHRSDDEDEWEEQEVDAGDYGHLVYDVVDAGDDPCAFEFDDDESDDDDAAAGTKKTKRRSKGGARKEKPRRMTAAERAGLVDTHKAHLLCLIARAAAYDRAASSPLARAMAASVVPREIAFALGSRESAPSREDVARVAEWFAGHVDLVKAGTKGPRGVGFERGRGRGMREGGSKGAKGDAGGVIVLDESSDEDEPDDTNGNTPRGEQSPPRHQAPPPDDDPNPTARRLAAIEAARESSRTSPTLRLCFALHSRAATQEEATALFVAAARGLGCEARTCVALEPVPLRASAASLERAGILPPRPAELWTVDGVSRSKSLKANAKAKSETETTKSKAKKAKKTERGKTETETEEAPSAETNAAPTRFAEPVTHWAEVLCRDDESDEGGDASGGDASGGGVWVTVVPHSARGRRESNERRRSFGSGRASVDDPGVVAASRDSPLMPYVFGFRSRLVASFGSSADRRLVESGYRWGAKDLTRKYAETFSRVGPHRVDESWLRSTTTRLAAGDRDVDEFRAADDVQSSDRPRLLEVSALARGACRDEDVHMDAKCLTERVPSTFAELRGHPLWAVERFLTKTQCIHPRFPVKGFIQGECVFPRSCVRELRSAERWKAECRRAVLVSELQKPAKRMHSRIQAARARVKKAKKDAERINAARAQSLNSTAGRGKNGVHPPRRKGVRSVEQVAAAMSERENAGANGGPGAGANGEEEEEEEEGEVFLYGEWQTEPWDPPAAKDGVVPKNDRGNVDLHGAALPPPGTVHVNLPRIARVARTLGIDYAAALVGFEFHRGGKTTPRFEGVVVCEEFEGRLREAHAEEEARLVAAKAERERREAKARWRVLFSAMWTRLSLREEFAMDEFAMDGGGEPDFDETRGEETVDREKRARSVADEEDGENDGGTKRVRLGAAAEVEEL